jgi:hypothetical protein
MPYSAHDVTLGIGSTRKGELGGGGQVFDFSEKVLIGDGIDVPGQLEGQVEV